MSAAPSRIARAAVPEQWGTIDRVGGFRRIGPGVYGVRCSGHGGVIVVESAAQRLAMSAWADAFGADLVPDALERAWVNWGINQETIRVFEGVFQTSGGRHRRLLPSDRYVVHPGPTVVAHDVVVLEEDCDWALAVVTFIADWSPAGGYTSFTTLRDALTAARSSIEWRQEFDVANRLGIPVSLLRERRARADS